MVLSNTAFSCPHKWSKIWSLVNTHPFLEAKIFKILNSVGVKSIFLFSTKASNLLRSIKRISPILIFLPESCVFLLKTAFTLATNSLGERITFLSLLFLGFVMVFTAPNHYLQTHIWKHIFKNHFFRVLAWTFLALFIVNYGLKFWNLETFVKTHMVEIFFIALIVGIIPESGPHMVFVMMFAKGLIPFSVLLASSIVQDGHGMLPLLSHSVKDSLAVKMFNIVIGLILGGALYLLGF